MSRTRARERYFQRQQAMGREGTSVALGTASIDGAQARVTAAIMPEVEASPVTPLTRDTWCAIGVHSEGCGCDA